MPHVPHPSNLAPMVTASLSGGLLAGLRERGHRVEIVSRLDVRDVWRGRIPARRLIREAIRVWSQMKSFRPEAWLVYMPCLKNPDLLGWWQLPKSYVLYGPGTSIGKRVRQPWRSIFKLVHNTTLRRADRVVALHPKHYEELLALGVKGERLTVLPPSVKGWHPIPSQPEARRQLELPLDVPTVLCVTRLPVPQTKKNRRTEAVLEFLQAITTLPSDTSLLIVGDGPGRKHVEERIEQLRLHDRVRLFGSVEHDDMKWFYAACDCFAYPYREERNYVPYGEAQACGRPVIAMRTRVAEATIDAGRAGLLAQDFSEFQRNLAELLRDRGRCESMGRAGQEYIAAFHSMTVRVQQIEDLLHGRSPTVPGCGGG